LVELTQADDIPYVCVLDDQGSKYLGDVTVAEVSQGRPHHRYACGMSVIPTHEAPVPVEVDP
jgi:hypothetical protein